MMCFASWEKKLTKKNHPGAVICKNQEEAIKLLTLLRDRCYRWEAGTVIIPDLHAPKNGYPMKYVIYPWAGIVNPYTEDLYPIVAAQVISEMEVDMFTDFIPPDEEPEEGPATGAADAEPLEEDEVTKEDLMRAVHYLLKTDPSKRDLYMLLEIYGAKKVLSYLEDIVKEKKARNPKATTKPKTAGNVEETSPEETPSTEAIAVVVPLQIRSFFW